MKSIIASILTIIYSVFITGSLWITQGIDDYAFDASERVYTLSESKESVQKSFSQGFDVVHFSKVIKHLAVGGKTKVPRASYTSAVYTNFLSLLNPHHSSLAVAIQEPELFPQPIFLKNRVLRI